MVYKKWGKKNRKKRRTTNIKSIYRPENYSMQILSETQTFKRTPNINQRREKRLSMFVGCRLLYAHPNNCTPAEKRICIESCRIQSTALTSIQHEMVKNQTIWNAKVNERLGASLFFLFLAICRHPLVSCRVEDFILSYGVSYCFRCIFSICLIISQIPKEHGAVEKEFSSICHFQHWTSQQKKKHTRTQENGKLASYQTNGRK